MMNSPAMPPTIILAAEPFNTHATAIANQLRQSGWNPIVTPTPQQYAGQAQACVVFLANDSVGSSTVSDAQNAGFLHLIPVFLQPMALPPGAWSAAPILVGMDDAATGRELADTLVRVQSQRPSSVPPPVVPVPSGPPVFAPAVRRRIRLRIPLACPIRGRRCSRPPAQVRHMRQDPLILR